MHFLNIEKSNFRMSKSKSINQVTSISCSQASDDPPRNRKYKNKRCTPVDLFGPYSHI